MELEKSIKNGKIEGKITGPLFPRLHVDDTKKAGPRAPPRNKMALYHEQLSILPQRFSNTQTSTLQSPPVHGCILTNMSSSNQVVCTERGLVSPYKNSPAPAHSNGKQTSRSYEAMISDNTSTNFTNKSIQMNVAEKSLPKVTCKSFEPFSLSQLKRPIINKDEAELRVPMFMHPHLSLDSSNNHSGSTKDRLLVGASCSLELQTTTSAKEVKTFMSTDLESERNVRGFNSDRLEVHEAVQVHDKRLIDIPEGSQGHDRNSTRDEQSESSYHMVNESDISNVRGHMDMSRQVKKVSEGVDHTRDVHQRTLDDGNQLEENRSCTRLVNLEDRNEDRSHTPVKDCASGAVISSDAVVEMIGQKYFWQARKTIIHQQRVFSRQVFELHRIIKVQKMLVDSRNTQQTAEHFPWGNAFLEPTSMKELLSISIPEAPSWHARSRNEPRKTKLSVYNPIENPTLLPLSFDTTSTATNLAHNINKPANSNLPMWCLPPPGNQWLLPVISPSEGLVYKPYPHPPPPPPHPPPGFLATLYSECGPTHAPTTPSEDLLKSPNGFDSTYFAPYGMPPITSSFGSGSPIQQMAGLASFNNFGIIYPSSCVSTGNRNVGEAKESEKMDNIKSCPKKFRTSYDALPLFPTAPTSFKFGQPVQSCNNEQKTQVIKVIPRNPRLASESAARIIKLIQDERKTLL